MEKNQYVAQESAISHFLFTNTRSAWIWLVIRLYLGWTWLAAGWGKLGADAWTGDQSGAALAGFIRGALEKTAGAHPDVQGWYAAFLEGFVLPHASTWAHAIAWGEVLVGLGLILGAFTGIAAFFGLFMNLNFLLAGTVSTNPILFVISVGVILAWKVAGYIGADRWILPRISSMAIDKS